MKKEIFNRIIDCVSNITEIDKEDILSNKKNSDIIEARCLVIHYCKHYGMTNEYLMMMFKKSSVGTISNMIHQYDVYYKSSRIFQYFDKAITNKIAEIFS